MNKAVIVAAVAVAALTTGCKYGSREQAFRACLDWRKAGNSQVVHSEHSTTGTFTKYERQCELEWETNQYLGKADGKVVRNFRF